MRATIILLVLLCAVFRAMAVPVIKQDTSSELNEQLKNFQNQMATLGNQFKNVFQTVTKESKLGLDKRGIETNGVNKSKEMDLVREQLQDVSKQLYNLREKVDSLKNSLAGNSDDDFDLDRREVKSSSNDANSPECIKKSIVQESDPFILNIALTIMKRINAKEKRLYIEKLVNATADHLVVKMAATAGVKNFHKRLLNAVLQLLKVRSILTIKTEGEFIDMLEPRKSRTLEPVDKNVDRIKVVQALEELLEGPMIKGFVSKVEEEKMINSAVKSLGDVLGLSKNKTKSVVQTMISRVKEDEKASEHGKEQVKPMTDDEKIKGLEKLVVDKAKENKLNVKEVKYLVKGLSAAVGARNNLSASQTEKLENQILKGVQDYFAEIKLSEGVKKDKEEDKDILKKLEELDELVGFRPAQSKNDVEKLEAHKKTKESSDEKLKRQLKNLNKLASNLLNSTSLSGLSGGDTGDQVIIDAATNTYGSTRIVEQHNIRPEQVQTFKNVPNKSDDATNNGTKFTALLDELEKLITTIKTSISSSKTTRDRIFVDAAKGTIGERKVDESFKKKRGLSEIISDAISLIKSLKEKQPNSEKTKAIAKALQTIVPTKTSKPIVEPKKATPSKDVEGKTKKSEISDLMTAEIEKAEARIQKELEDLQKSEEKNIKLLEDEKKKEKKAEKEEKEEKQKEKEKKEEENEKQKEKEKKEGEKKEEENEKQKQNEKAEKEKEEQKEETVNEKKKESEGKMKDDENLEQKPRQQKNHSNQTKIVVDEKEIEKELEAQTNAKENLIDKLQRVDASSMKKRGLFEIISDAISLIKSLKGKQANSRKSEATTKALQTTVPTKTLKPSVEPKKATQRDVEGKAEKSEISDVIKVEVEKAEAKIQKELEDLQKSEEKNIRLVEDEKKKEKNAEKKEKEEKQNEKEKKEEENEKQKQNEKAEKEKQEQKEETVNEKKKESEGKMKDENLVQKSRQQNKIQKELEDLQKSEEKNIKLLEEYRKKEKNAEKKEKEEKQKEKEKKETEEKQKEKEKKEEENEKQKQNEEAEREKQKQKEDTVKEKKKENEHLKQKARTQKSHGNQTKKNDIPGESKSQIMEDEREIEKELEAQTNGKEKLIADKLQSLQAKPKMENSKETNKEGNSELIKELNELFATN